MQILIIPAHYRFNRVGSTNTHYGREITVGLGHTRTIRYDSVGIEKLNWSIP